MQRVRNDTLNGVLLIAILSFYGCRLARSTWALDQRPLNDQGVASHNQTLVFQSAGGIDVLNKPVSPSPSPNGDRLIAFLLRDTNIEADLAFWRDVEHLLPKNAGVRLVGYCSDNPCAAAVKRDSRPIDFPVIIYGEVLSSQAILNSDEKGNAVLWSKKWLLPKPIGWRMSGQTPQKVIQEALR